MISSTKGSGWSNCGSQRVRILGETWEPKIGMNNTTVTFFPSERSSRDAIGHRNIGCRFAM